MELNYSGLIGKLAQGAAIWIAVIAIIVLPLGLQDYFYLITFLLILLVNFTLILTVKIFAPEFFAKSPYAEFIQSKGPASSNNSPNQNIGFRLSPLSYPKVHDEELRAFVPEFVRVDIVGNAKVLFSGNVPRNALKQLRQAITDSLEAKLPATPQEKTPAATQSIQSIAPQQGTAISQQASKQVVPKKTKAKK
ncbi:MAG: hypothetical protein WC408_02040 [Candidatus Micrarchaeia archaeon]|jgi:hypothetical protein